MENMLTIDVEEWFDATSMEGYIKNKSDFKSLVVKQTTELLKILNEYKTKATFFMLGYIAENFPGLIRDIVVQGHEIGTHGYSHKLATSLTDSEFKEEIVKSRVAIEAVAGEGSVVGYRAPSWSITADMGLRMEFLEKEGFLYDSSLFSHKLKYRPGCKTRVPHVIEGTKKLWEVPPSVTTDFNIPFSGGLFLRFFPYSFIGSAINKLNLDNISAVVYLHPWEMDTQHPRLKVALTDKLIHYYNIETTEWKFRALLRDFRFVTIKQWLSGRNADRNI